MEVIIILIVIAGGSWLVFSIFGSLTRTRPVSRFGMPLGNPEVIDTLVLKAYKKLKGPKKYTIEETKKNSPQIISLKLINILELLFKMSLLTHRKPQKSKIS